ncbi:MAG TPA: hypothetical protein VFB37_04020, partial [Steroidobacteraceae bacterium]|nr:hypothetical protein [Steroidobacteraceae bacterium]
VFARTILLGNRSYRFTQQINLHASGAAPKRQLDRQARGVARSGRVTVGGRLGTRDVMRRVFVPDFDFVAVGIADESEGLVAAEVASL